MQDVPLRVGEVLLFVSDLHLCASRPATTAAFLRFLAGPARSASRLLILGDLFEYWAGDDDESPFTREIAQALRACGEAGTTCCFVAGNRDFLLGPAYAAQAGLGLLDEPLRLPTATGSLLLMHGDTLCTDDHAYQAFRQQVRSPHWQAEFLSRPLAERRAIVEGARRQSESAKQDKAAAIMDANDAAIETVFRHYPDATLIHGHTHRMHHHIHRVDGHERHRWVLPEWHERPRYLRWQDGQAEFIED